MNNYLNQLLRLPLLKYTPTHKGNNENNKNNNNNNNNNKAIPTSFPKKKASLQHLGRRPPRRQSRNRSRQLLSQRPPP